MQILPSIAIPTPFGTLHTLAIQTPPMKLPNKPDKREFAALRLAIGQDVATLFGLIPYVGDILSEKIDDMHEAEIMRTLDKDEYAKFVNNAKVFPSTVAMGQTLLFKEVKSAKEIPKSITGLLPTPPSEGPPFPRFMNAKWPKIPVTSKSR